MMFALLLAGANPQLVNGWSIERGAERCVATRTAGGAHDTIKVEIKSPLSSDFGGTIQLSFPALAVPPASASPNAPPPEPIRVTIAPTDISGIITYRDGVAMAAMAVTSSQMDQVRRLSSLQVQLDNGPAIAVDLGGTPSPITALKACGDDVVRSWGADPTAVIGAGSPGRSASWFLSDDYPKDALRAGIEGRVVYLVSIDRAGKPMTCKVVATTGNASLDSRTCELALIRGVYAQAPTTAPDVRWAVGAVNWRL
jgi:TonB family protein